MMGFTPGFAYLWAGFQVGDPRLANPRTHVPAGSVGIAGNQTGEYPRIRREDAVDRAYGCGLYDRIVNRISCFHGR